ncbi:hypothetical protein LRAMOSA01909 [Lichtheimia ramosa]|uniref:C2H2-type domain-containing protein n=1 Tax=Lichtheimia ramosa TaxID=688394 RepID=A0A077WKQ7_9FUNG|nr:hypothetical protein LRAMOSA01909 [Lichtheimia ramosa]
MQHEESRRLSKDSPLSVTDSSGRQVSLLNDNAAAAAAAAAAAVNGLPRPVPNRMPMEYEPSPREAQQYMTTTSSPSSLSSSSGSSPEENNSGNVPKPAGTPWSPHPIQQQQQASPSVNNNASPQQQQQQKANSRRKYHCTEPGCNKSFTTSGHLARHNRIHTGEKNFPCLFPGCQSRFSRQDNMMQHYRTHMSPKSRRSQRGKANGAPANEEPRPRPRLHAHHRIRSDPFRVEPPLTIDQHLSNYHRSLLTPSARTERFSPTRYNNNQQQPSPIARPSPVAPVPVATSIQHVSPSSTQPLANSTSTTPATPVTPLMSSTHSTTPILNASPSTTAAAASTSTPAAIVSSSSTPSTTTTPLSSTTSSSPPAIFYQHRPLTTNLSLLDHPAGQAPPFEFTTLLHPPVRKADDDSSSDGLRQLAHVVSTFG